MEVLRLFFGVLDALVGVVDHSMVERMLAEEPFRAGWVWGIITLAFLILASQVISYLWDRVLKFFSATKAPASSAGPKPVDLGVGCSQGLMGLAGITVVLLLILLRIILPI